MLAPEFSKWRMLILKTCSGATNHVGKNVRASKKNLSSSEDKETKRALIRLYWYLESYSWDAFSEEYFEQYKKHYTSNTGQLLTLKPNGTVYTKTGGDNFVNLSCGFPFNPKFGNTSRIPISECLWTRTIQFESGKNFSEKFFCKVSMSM